MATFTKEVMDKAMDEFLSNIQKLNNVIYTGRAQLAQRNTYFDDVKFLLDLFELIATSRFHDAHQKIIFMRDYLFKYIPRPILAYLKEKEETKDPWE